MKVRKCIRDKDVYKTKSCRFLIRNVPKYFLYLNIITDGNDYKLKTSETIGSTLLLILAGAVFFTFLEESCGSLGRWLGLCYMLIVITRYLLNSKLCEVSRNVTIERL